jgi:hypothetical protein
MLIIDGVKYNLWIPKEEKQLEEMVKEHSKEIFGKDSIYFDLRQKLTSKSGVMSIPDGYVISFSKPFDWYIVEGELSTHPLHEHVTNQLNKFVIGVKNPLTQRELVDALYNEINNNKVLRAYVETMIASTEIKGFLYDLISKPPKIVVVIEEKGNRVQEACEGLKVEPIVVEFKTYIREDAEAVHAHLFEPFYKPEVKEVPKVHIEVPKEIPAISREELASMKAGMVVICPSKPEGVNFLLQHNAWGFVRIRRKPEYFALYISHPESKILFFGEVEDVLYPQDPESPLTEEEARSYKEFKQGKKIIVLKLGSLRKLDKGIPKGTAKRGRLQGLKYAILSKFTNAKTLDNL